MSLPHKISRAFALVLPDGTELFPVQIRRRTTGRVAFRVSPGGTGGNMIVETEQVDERTMFDRVVRQGYSVRCASLDGTIQGQYMQGGRAKAVLRMIDGRP
jgi:hypothetical protein